jgi:tetratricopeptide (TPR) repeat protein
MKFKFFAITLLSVLILSANADAKRRVGFIPFKNNGARSNTNWIAFGLEYNILNKLSFLSSFYVSDKEVFEKALKESGFYQKPLTEKMIYQIGKAAGVEVIISGSYTVNGRKMKIEVVYSNASNGAPILRSKYEDSVENIFVVSDKIVQEFITLAGSSISALEQKLLKFQLTQSTKAYKSFILGYIENNKKNRQLRIVISAFKLAIQQDPKFWEAYYNLGIAYYNSKSYDQSLIQFNKVINALPNFDKPYFGRGLNYAKQKQYSKAEQDFLKVVELNPNDFKAYYYLGKIKRIEQKFTEAKTYLNKSKELNADYAACYAELGSVEYKQQKYREAIAHYKKAVKLEPDNGLYHLRLGDCFYRSQIYYNAYLELKEAIRYRPHDANAHFLFGITIYQQAVLEELIDAFLELLDSDSGSKEKSSSTFGRKTALNPVKQRKVYEDMADAFTKAAQANPRFMEATFNLALTYEEMGKLDSAERYYVRALQINPKLVRAHMKLAKLYTATERSSKAIDQYKKLFYIEPGMFVQQPTLGPEHRYINVYKMFKAELDEKLKNNPRDPESIIVLAKIFKAHGQYGKASNLLRNVIKANPGNKEAKNILAKLTQKMK